MIGVDWALKVDLNGHTEWTWHKVCTLWQNRRTGCSQRHSLMMAQTRDCCQERTFFVKCNGVPSGVRCPVWKRCWPWPSEVADDFVVGPDAVGRENGFSSLQLSRECPLELVNMVASTCCWHGETLARSGWHLGVVKVVSKAQEDLGLSELAMRTGDVLSSPVSRDRAHEPIVAHCGCPCQSWSRLWSSLW